MTLENGAGEFAKKFGPANFEVVLVVGTALVEPGVFERICEFA